MTLSPPPSPAGGPSEPEHRPGEWQEIDLDYESLYARAASAAASGSLGELISLAALSSVAVARAVSEGGLDGTLLRSVERNPAAGMRLYRQIRWHLNPELRRRFRSLLSKVALRSGMRIASVAPGRSMRILTQYEPGMDFDAEETIQRLLSSGKSLQDLTYEDIVGVRMVERSRGAVIILDASGSMTGGKIAAAALSAAVAAHLMRADEYAIVAFNTEPFVLKGVRDRVPIERVIEEILDLAPLGYTNMKGALEVALKQGALIKRPDKRYVLITDGLYNVGGDPRSVARRLSGLNVIGVRGWGGRETAAGMRLCAELAKMGGGKFIELRSPQGVPTAVARILES